MRVLLVWNNAGKSEFYSFEADESDIALLESANGKFNADEDEALDTISDYLCSDEKGCASFGDPKNCQWSDKKIDTPIRLEGAHVIYECGWFD